MKLVRANSRVRAPLQEICAGGKCFSTFVGPNPCNNLTKPINKYLSEPPDQASLVLSWHFLGRCKPLFYVAEPASHTQLPFEALARPIHTSAVSGLAAASEFVVGHHVCMGTALLHTQGSKCIQTCELQRTRFQNLPPCAGLPPE